jgi:hypothetical protein
MHEYSANEYNVPKSNLTSYMCYVDDGAAIVANFIVDSVGVLMYVFMCIIACVCLWPLALLGYWQSKRKAE